MAGKSKKQSLSSKDLAPKHGGPEIESRYGETSRPTGTGIPRPVPLSRELSVDEVEWHRRDDCVDYEHCLDQASAAGWKSFTCKGCNACWSDPDKKVEHADEPSVQSEKPPMDPSTRTQDSDPDTDEVL